MASIRSLAAPNYTDEERIALIDFVLSLKKSEIERLLREAHLPRTGTKSTLRVRIDEALSSGALDYAEVIGLLDAVTPWGKQHVFLLGGPPMGPGRWLDAESTRRLLLSHDLDHLFNARLPMILPDHLTLSAIDHDGGVLRVVAVEKRMYAERAEEYDEWKGTDTGKPISLRAYVNHVTRTIVTFEWDLRSNTAMLRITQLYRDADYDAVAASFKSLVRDWLEIDAMFLLLDLRGVNKKLYDMEKAGSNEARSHDYQFMSPAGRRVSVRSPSATDSVLGEVEIDAALAGVGDAGVGRLGNFYWLPRVSPGPASNPLASEVHVIIVANKSRINFTTPNSESDVRYVLHRIRAHC